MVKIDLLTEAATRLDDFRGPIERVILVSRGDSEMLKIQDNLDLKVLDSLGRRLW